MNTSKTPIVFQALPKVDAPYASTALTIAKELSKDRLVFYVEHPFSWADLFRKDRFDRIRNRSNTPVYTPFPSLPNFVAITPPLIPPINRLPNNAFFSLLRKMFLKDLWKQIDKVLHSYQVMQFDYVNSFDPIFAEVHSTIPCKSTTYHCVDWIAGESYIAKHGVREEKKAAESADMVITTSEPLKTHLEQYNGNTHCIPNAADIAHFSKKAPEPEEYKHIEGKKIVYTGNIGHRMDYAALLQQAFANPQWNFIFVGPMDQQYFEGHTLFELPNVHFLGAKPYSVLPSYVQHADALIIPFKCNELTKHIYPLKINEYLATGKPVVSSNFSDLKEFKGLIHTYTDGKSFTNSLFKALHHDDRFEQMKRRNAVQENTWENRVAAWKSLLDIKFISKQVA